MKNVRYIKYYQSLVNWQLQQDYLISKGGFPQNDSSGSLSEMLHEAGGLYGIEMSTSPPFHFTRDCTELEYRTSTALNGFAMRMNSEIGYCNMAHRSS